MHGLTVGLQRSRLAAATSCLVDGFDDEDVLGTALQAMNRVVVLLDVGDDHPAIRRITETWKDEVKYVLATIVTQVTTYTMNMVFSII